MTDDRPKFTPGPWWVLREGSDLSVEPGIASWSKFDIMGRTEEEIQAMWQEMQSNAALISLAPKLLDFVSHFTSANGEADLHLLDKHTAGHGTEIHNAVFELLAELDSRIPNKEAK